MSSRELRSNNMPTQIITGAAGFIGSHLVEALLQKGAEVRCLVRKSSDLKWIKGLAIEYAWGDCCDRASLKEAVKGVDLVFHSAGVTRAVKEETFYHVNADGTGNLIQACLEYAPHLRRFIYLSSQAAAGPSRNGARKKETDPCEPVSDYGRSKRMGEEIVLAHAKRLPLVILRPSAVYGPRDKDIYVFFKFLSKRINPCLSDPAQRISLCHIQDLVQAVLLAAENPALPGEIFFVSDGQDYPKSGTPLPGPWRLTLFASAFPNGSFWESPLFQNTSPMSPESLLSSARGRSRSWSKKTGFAISLK